MSSNNRRAHNLSQSSIANPNAHGQARNLGTDETINTTRSYSEHAWNLDDETTGIELVSRTMSSQAQLPNKLQDREYASRKLPEPPIMPDSSSWTSRRDGGSKPSTEGTSHIATGYSLPSTVHPTFYGKGRHSCDSSTCSHSAASSGRSHVNWASISENCSCGPQQIDRSECLKSPDSGRGSTHEWDQDRQSAFIHNETGRNSTQSSFKTRASTFWSTVSDAATSITSLSSGRSRTKPPKLDLEIPDHSLAMATDILAQNSRSANTTSQTPTIFNSDQGILPQTSGTSRETRQISTIHTSSPQDLYAGPSDQATPASPIDDREILDSTTEASPQVTRTNSQNDPIEQAIQSPLPTFYSENGVVTSGTLEGLVQFLITGFDLPGHTYYRDTFLTACSELTTPGDLFQILSRRLAEEMPTSNDGFAKQYTIFLVIIHWLKSDIFPPKDELLYRIKVFCEDAVRLYPSIEPVAIETCRLIDLKVTRPTTFRTSNPDEPILNSSQIKPFGLAIALSLLEGDHYKGLQASDYLLHLTNGQSEKIQNYRKTNEKIGLWVIQSILHYDTASSRSEVMKFFTYTALECYSMRNFSSTVAILNALHSVLIEELKATTRATRKALPKRIQAKLPSLYDIINPQSNHRGYRDAIQSAATVAERDICIPWLPVHLMELNKVFRYQPLTVQVDGQHLVNFDRYNRFMERTKEILHYSPPDLEEKRRGGQLRYLLDQLRDIDLSSNLEQRLVERSRTLRTRELSVNTIYDENLRRTGFAYSKSQ